MYMGYVISKCGNVVCLFLLFTNISQPYAVIQPVADHILNQLTRCDLMLL